MRRALPLAVALGLTLVAVPFRADHVGAQSIPVGELTVVDVDGDRLESGGSATPFTLRLPGGAECPGDSADDDYRVNSYMVPTSVDPLEVTYDGLGPTPSQYGPGKEYRQPLFDVDTTFFVSVQTEDAEDPGAPGKILDLPFFDFDVFKPGDVPPGRYNVGIACTLLNEIERVWNTQIEVVEDPADQPAQIRWSVIGFEAAEDSDPPYLVIAGGAVAVAALTLVLLRRRRPAR